SAPTPPSSSAAASAPRPARPLPPAPARSPATPPTAATRSARSLPRPPGEEPEQDQADRRRGDDPVPAEAGDHARIAVHEVAADEEPAPAAPAAVDLDVRAVIPADVRQHRRADQPDRHVEVKRVALLT